MQVVIFANGKEPCPPDAVRRANSADFIIAADGGAEYCDNFGIVPDVLVGDLDSIAANLLKQYETEDVEIIRHPVRKDSTDLELALEIALERGAERIELYGALGGRWDMSIANIFLAGAGKFSGLEITLYGVDCQMHILQPLREQRFSNYLNTPVTLLPLFGDVTGVSLQGFEYPLRGAKIVSGSTHGVSNVIVERSATINHQDGVLLCIISCT
ncbi:thiamine diphosphokinase [Desulfosediminicola flagellatus]|uniref:thiamine diphosphokinase n=1 Tax=Desulfosediminicola flagellatus TaxID=2569541 RepID=UPI0010ACFB2F|nr:thiamine diphosphokinase [Desulfosediminicola flagellatus]